MTLKTFILCNQPEYLKLLFLAVFLLSACKEKRPPRVIQRSFYYWKSSLKLNPTEQKALTDLKVKRLYVKFFDVGWNTSKSEPMPVAILEFPGNHEAIPYNIIPTVFITNDCMTKIKDPEIKELANKIVLLIKHICLTNGIETFSEIQMDCDWTESTRDKYFLLLQTIKNLMATDKKKLSATIRLYQYKYYKRAGIPPVDRGLLMCYNMGNLKNPDTRNSILEPEELGKYMNGLTAYPLSLDIALPIFSWKVLFRNKKYAGLINGLPTELITNNSSIKQFANKFEVLGSLSINGYNFEQGDVIRDEAVTYDELIKAEKILNNKLKTPKLTVVLYHLDSITLSKFSTHELEAVFDYLN